MSLGPTPTPIALQTSTHKKTDNGPVVLHVFVRERMYVGAYGGQRTPLESPLYSLLPSSGSGA